MVTDEQVRKLRTKMSQGSSQEAAAAKAGMSERSGRTWQDGPLPSQTKEPRSWRTRADPFAGVWETIVVPLLRADPHRQLEAPTLLAVLRKHDPQRFEATQLRTLQRRLVDWRALQSEGRDVVFPQRHPPGREAAFGFTHCTELGVTIAGVLLPHLLFVLVLPFSSWVWICVAFGETFEAMLGGIQGALWELGGVTEVMRSDNLSAATHELARAGGRGLTRRYKALLDHYGLKSTRINPGESQENGGVESRNGRIKSALAQALIVRGSCDFPDLATYEAFARGVVAERVCGHDAAKLAEERARLRPLPSAAVPTWSTFTARVSRWSTVEISKRIYSVPSRLIGHRVEVRVHADHLEVRYRHQLTATMPRLHGAGTARIDYRDIIWSLVRKPGAFARYRFREELFPTVTFRRAYDALCAHHGARADVEYVRVLHLAASTMQTTVEVTLTELLEAGGAFNYIAVRDRVAPTPSEVPTVSIDAPDLRDYDALLTARVA